MPPSVEADIAPPSKHGDNNHDIIASFSGPNDDMISTLGVNLANVNLNTSNATTGGSNMLFGAKNFHANSVSFSSGSGDRSRGESPSSTSIGPNNSSLNYGNDFKVDRGIDGLQIQHIQPYSQATESMLFTHGSYVLGDNLLGNQLPMHRVDSISSAPSSSHSNVSLNKRTMSTNSLGHGDRQGDDLYGVVTPTNIDGDKRPDWTSHSQHGNNHGNHFGHAPPVAASKDQGLWNGHNNMNHTGAMMSQSGMPQRKTRVENDLAPTRNDHIGTPHMNNLAHSHSHSSHVPIIMAPHGNTSVNQQPQIYQTPPFDQGMSSAGTVPKISLPHNPNQVFYMAVPMQNGQGQVLQPVQVVQLPNGHSTLVVPASHHPVIHDAHLGKMPQGRNSNDPRVGAGKPHQQGYHRHPVDGHAPHFSSQTPSPTYNVSNGDGNRKRDKRNKGKGSNERSPHDNGHNNSDAASPGFRAQPPMPPQEQFDNGRDRHIADGSPVPSDALTALYHSTHRPPLSSLLGHVRRLSRDQVGCRLLQQSLDEDDAHAATAILHEGLPFIAETMTDPFGNYLFQKILEKITAEERLLLIKTVSPRLVNAALNLHGTRSVQKVVEMSIADDATPAQQNAAAEAVTKSLVPAAARLCIDSHGNHVIQRILQRLPHKHSKFIFEAVAKSVGDVARHRHGCCVIQRCLDSPSSPARSNLVRRIVDKALDLMQDAYGNYVVQYVLDVCGDDEAAAVCESVIGKVGLLAIQKFSSNVMEKCLERSSDWVQEAYLRELSMPDKISELMTDPFGNYVVQRALSVATHAQAVRLVEAMRPHLPAIRNTAGGRRIVAKICRRFPHFNLSVSPTNVPHPVGGHNMAPMGAPMGQYPRRQMNFHGSGAPPVPPGYISRRTDLPMQAHNMMPINDDKYGGHENLFYRYDMN